MTQKEVYITFYGFTEEEYLRREKALEMPSSTPEEAYRRALEINKHWLSEEDFLRLYYQKEDRVKLSSLQNGAFGHIYVAYQRLLRERGEL